MFCGAPPGEVSGSFFFWDSAKRRNLASDAGKNGKRRYMSILSRKTHGLTLVEVVISVGLISLAITALLSTIVQSSVFSRRVDVNYTASYLAQRRIDILKRIDFSQLEFSEESDVRIGADGNMDPDGQYLRSTVITTDFDSNSYLTKVNVIIKKVKINLDGTIEDPETGEYSVIGEPVEIETLFSDVI